MKKMKKFKITLENVGELKELVSNLYEAYKSLTKCWNERKDGISTYPATIIIEVALQNMVEICSYIHFVEDEVNEEFFNRAKAIEMVNAQQRNCYMTKYAAQELEFIFLDFYHRENSGDE